ncbi:hypothetical protein, partial [Staphylococcus aureus]|uniref:hypothetical protein n=1 Tax=Staphylococcus aureus TaxID=1280 RepID=UPI00289098F3
RQLRFLCIKKSRKFYLPTIKDEEPKKLRNDAERERLKVEIARYKLDRMYIEQSTCDFKQRSSNVPEKFESEIKDANEDEANNDFDNR